MAFKTEPGLRLRLPCAFAILVPFPIISLCNTGYMARLSSMGDHPTIDRLKPYEFLFLLAISDMDDLTPILFPKDDDLLSDISAAQGTETGVGHSGHRLSAGQVRGRIARGGRCSALVKVTPDLSDILIGHVTWWTYASMNRIYKVSVLQAGLACMHGLAVFKQCHTQGCARYLLPGDLLLQA